MRIKRPFAFIFLIGIILSSCSTLSITEIRLSEEDYSAVVRGSVISGQSDLYSLEGEEGRTLGISITSPKNNAVIAIFLPGAQAAEEDGAFRITGTALPDAGEKDNINTWKGPLPASGKYLIKVSAGGGNAAYEIKIMVR